MKTVLVVIGIPLDYDNLRSAFYHANLPEVVILPYSEYEVPAIDIETNVVAITPEIGYALVEFVAKQNKIADNLFELENLTESLIRELTVKQFYESNKKAYYEEAKDRRNRAEFFTRISFSRSRNYTGKGTRRYHESRHYNSRKC